LYLVELFVEQSGYEFVESDVATVEVILSVARGDIEYQELVAWFGERILRG
jgi:hypothetical protein